MVRLEKRGASGTLVAACEFCHAFCSAQGGAVRHARSCRSGVRGEYWTPEPTPGRPEATAELGQGSRSIDEGLPLNTVGNGAAEDAWHATNSLDPRNWDRAMNRDD